MIAELSIELTNNHLGEIIDEKHKENKQNRHMKPCRKSGTNHWKKCLPRMSLSWRWNQGIIMSSGVPHFQVKLTIAELGLLLQARAPVFFAGSVASVPSAMAIMITEGVVWQLRTLWELSEEHDTAVRYALSCASCFLWCNLKLYSTYLLKYLRFGATNKDSIGICDAYIQFDARQASVRL